MRKIINTINKHKGITIISCIIVFAVTISSVLLLNPSKEPWQPKINKITFEYGDTKELTATDFISKEDKDIKFIEFDIEIPTDKVKILEKETAVYQIGNYKGNLIVEENNKQVKHPIEIIIKDTTAPKFINFKEEIKIVVGMDNIKLENYFLAEDLNDLTISVAGDIDFKKEGKYDITVTATDSYGNKTIEQSSVVVVISKEEAEKNGVTEIISETDENGNVIVATPEAIQENTNSQINNSSDNGSQNNENTNHINNGNSTDNSNGANNGNTGGSTGSGGNNTGGNETPTPTPTPTPPSITFLDPYTHPVNTNPAVTIGPFKDQTAVDIYGRRCMSALDENGWSILDGFGARGNNTNGWYVYVY